MPTVNYFVGAKKRKIAPIYVRLSAGRGTDLIVKSGLMVNPAEWSSRTQSIKQRIRTQEDDDLILKLKDLKDHIEGKVKNSGIIPSRTWLDGVIYQYHNKKEQDGRTLNEFIEKFITDIEEGKRRKHKSALNITPGTGRALRGFQRIFLEYQGIYTEKRLTELEKENKSPRPKKIIDFNDVTVDFGNSFRDFLIDEGYKVNSVGRFLKQLKYFMNKSFQDKKHSNLDFKQDAFPFVTEEAFTISLNPGEIQVLHNYDLSRDKQMEIARDKFIVLCETALRVSDYDKIDVSIRTIKGVRLIDLYQTKTHNRVFIPLTRRMEEILRKYNGKLPRIHENLVNKYIKTVAFQAKLTETVTWETAKYGKRFSKSAMKWELISCHTGRRSGATNMFRAGIPPIDIMKITGHKTEREFLKYIREEKEDTAARLALHPYFASENLKVAR